MYYKANLNTLLHASYKILWWPLLLFISPWQIATALTLPIANENTEIVGKVFKIQIEPGDRFREIARRYQVGYQELVYANPHVNPNKIKAWSHLTIPQSFILPDAPRTGIVINLPEMRLYYYPPNTDTVMTYPIAVGRENWRTPIAKTRIIDKKADPAWHVPKSIKAHMLKKGVVLPDVVPAGPDNPLGRYALRLALPGYLIHGTNDPYSVGKRSSSGCIRMYPEDIEELFSAISVNTPVHIINQPVKSGWQEDTLYLESHQPFPDQIPQASMELPTILADDVEPWVHIQWDKAQMIKSQYTGIPQPIQSF